MIHKNNQLKELSCHVSDAWNLVKDFPGIVGIGLGLKEIRGIQTDQVAWRLYVGKKLPAFDLPGRHILPTSLLGIPTDVLCKHLSHLSYGNNTVDLLRPGVEIGSDAGSSGTLGCFAIRRGQPDKIVILSNSHVIYSDSASLGATSDYDIGQHKVSCSCCCKCKVIGNAKRADAVNAFGPWVITQVPGVTDADVLRGVETDCAIADFNKNRDYTNEIENVGMITGTPPSGNLGLSPGDSVEMMGSTSGHVRGKVLEFNFNARDSNGTAIPRILYPLALAGRAAEEDFAGVFPNIKQFIFIPDPDPTDPNRRMYFALPGDSGSVIVNSQRKVVALLSKAWNIGPDTATFLNQFLTTPLPAHVGSMGLANPIQKVLDNLNIDIPDNLHGTKISTGPMLMVPSLDLPETGKLTTNEWLSAKADELEEQLKTTAFGKHLIEKIARHRPEIFRLINHHRPVKVIWHRHKGPAFVTHCLKNVTDPTYNIPHEVEGISRELLIKRMAAALKEYGSADLSRDIDSAYPIVLKHLNDVDSFSEMAALLQSLSSQNVFEEIIEQDN